MSWLVWLVVPVVAVVLLWMLAAIGESKWESDIYEEWEE